ncbi:Membrane associated serine protease, rhomboid family [Robiginitalea myxolifaciens]|uniref:Membrane associated serine protease, rhomboid family n=1 Tax=Robiginitalea myxolifaciens TaxID=400055 RepID=A0A1I6FNB2_9FLAO|nr:rhomboid family intramembrane serine protease [Robiginitalea myxolifaciens]SFR31426.1 Membrane associated serine protease, rhomboid family [Robiginitalea myxolifaciens]
MGRLTDGIKHLLIINVLFYVASMLYGDILYQQLSLWYPEHPNFRIWQLVSHMFMHSPDTFMHILFNMYALWAFGTPLERMWGTKKFLFFYFSAGIGAALIHSGVSYIEVHRGLDTIAAAGFDPSQVLDLMAKEQYMPAWVEKTSIETVQSTFQAFNTPAVGASGAIYGVLVAFGMLFPNAELFLIFLPIPIKAKYFIPALIALDLFSGLTGYSIFGAGIAHFAHVGGALIGFLMMWYWKKNQFNQNRWN